MRATWDDVTIASCAVAPEGTGDAESIAVNSISDGRFSFWCIQMRTGQRALSSLFENNFRNDFDQLKEFSFRLAAFRFTGFLKGLLDRFPVRLPATKSAIQRLCVSCWARRASGSQRKGRKLLEYFPKGLAKRSLWPLRNFPPPPGGST